MTYLKFDIHAAGTGGNYDRFSDYVAAMSYSGRPAIVFAVDNSGPAVAVQDLGRPDLVLSGQRGLSAGLAGNAQRADLAKYYK